MNSQSDIAVSFTGNRLLTPPRDYVTHNLEGDICSMLSHILEECYKEGKKIFLSGGAVGFDTIAAEEVLRLKERHCDVELMLVVPFEGQDSKYPEAERERYNRLLSQADKVVKISEHYRIGAYHLRNEYLISHSSLIVAYNNSERSGGTASIIQRALKRGLEVINIYDMFLGINQEVQLQLPF
ncbi:MAG: SLOG family protein [Rikenellaceae bacterium]